jgi:tetratricopeptide (TPR) repeat protein
MLARKRYENAILELGSGDVPAEEQLQRFEAICREKPELEQGHRGMAETLFALGRISDAAEAQFRRFECPGADAGVVADDLANLARTALAKKETEIAVGILGRLHDHIADGADRALAVIGDDRRAPLLVLRSKLHQQLGRPEQAVRSLGDLARENEASRPGAAEALQEIVAAGQARPDADLALARVHQLMGEPPRALAVLTRLYEDDVTAKETVRDAAEEMVLDADDADVRLFLASVCLDLEDARGACTHAVQARRLRPAVRRDVVALLRRCLELEGSADIHFAIAEAYLAGDEADDAVRHFRAAVGADRGRAEATIRALEEAAPRSQNAALLWLSVGTTYAEHLGDPGQAVEAFTGGLEADPTAELRVPLLLGRGEAHVALEQHDEAFHDIDEAARHGTLERRYYEFLRSGHRRRELDAAQQARELAGSDFAAAADACQRLLRVDRPDDAVEVAQRCLAAAPEDVVPRYLVGVALHAADRLDAAARALETVRHQTGPDTEIGRAARMILAECHLDRGDRAPSRRARCS